MRVQVKHPSRSSHGLAGTYPLFSVLSYTWLNSRSRPLTCYRLDARSSSSPSARIPGGIGALSRRFETTPSGPILQATRTDFALLVLSEEHARDAARLGPGGSFFVDGIFSSIIGGFTGGWPFTLDPYLAKLLISLVGVAGFEPATPSSRTRWATRLGVGLSIRPTAETALIGYDEHSPSRRPGGCDRHFS